jgi:endonuclease/exonuclease/phosphatase family metal-dependent hydrolase
LRIRVITYNIHRAIGMDRRFRLQRIVEVLRHHGADIALLQEVDDGAPRSLGLDLGRELAAASDYPHLAIGHNVSLRKGRYGNATLSRFPILRERNIDLTIGTSKRRGCQHTSLSVLGPTGKEHPLEIFNLHLGLSARERRQQVGRLLESSEWRTMPPESACIIGGDFNDWRSQLLPIFLETMDFRSATLQSRGTAERCVRTYPSFAPRGSLDHLYYRGGLALEEVGVSRLRVARVASDHLPVIAEFELS